MVQGKVSVEIKDKLINESYIVETLQQGDIVGQYSVLFPNCKNMYMVKALTWCRVLHLPVSFFQEHRFTVPHLEEVLKRGMKFCERSGGPPILDFKIFKNKGDSTEEKWLRALKRAKVLSKLDLPSKQRFLQLLKHMQKVHKESEKEEGIEKLRQAMKKQQVTELNSKHRQELVVEKLNSSTRRSSID